MITITVKTLDSQNHQFSVEESLTVEQFKNHIAENVNVPAARQRIIYCGRVLQDTSKLSDYDVDGKVVHLVQRAPPTSNRNVRSLTPPPDLNRARAGFRGMDGGNAIYMGMGSMPVGPPGLMEGLPAPRAIHTLSSSRINVAKRMLRNAENVIRQLENPGASNDSAAQPEEPVEEEMTPVIEARVIVPTIGNQVIDGDAIINAVHNTIFPAVNNIEVSTTPFVPNSGPSTSSDPADSSTPQSTSQTAADSNNAAEPAPTESATNAGASQPEAPTRENRRRECHPGEMATLLTRLNQLQFRFTPFLARYQEFLETDPEVPEAEREETSQMLNRVSQVLHLLGHAYHSLSDIIVSLEQRRPRLLLCRPILIPPPNRLIQAGIPIQVEAQINLSADRPPTTTPASTTSSTTNSDMTSSTNTPTSSSDNAATPDSTNSSSTAQSTRRATIPLTSHMQQGFVGLPFPSGTMRVITTPVEIRMEQPTNQRPANNNNNTTAPPTSSVSSTTQDGAQQARPSTDNSQSGAQQPQGQGPPGGNMEFFMEVTPDALRNGNLIQSLMQMVSSQIGDTLNMANQRSENQNNQANGAQTPGQPSQARSTQTNPTTATHTRSTSRPHVHMTQQRVQGGFDPFLPCHSHHIDVDPRPTRVSSSVPRVVPEMQRMFHGVPSFANPASGQQQNTQPRSNVHGLPNLGAFPGGPIDFSRLFERVTDAVGNVLRQSTNQQPVPPRGAPDGQNAGNNDNLFFGANILSGLFDQNNPPFNNDMTLDMFLQSLHPEPYVQGTSLLIDFSMALFRNLRLNDVVTIQGGNLAPLYGQMDIIQRFFLTEVCQNDTTDAGIDRAAERIVSDFGPLINTLAPVATRDNIDIVASVQNLFRQRGAEIIRLAVNGVSAGEGNNAQRAEAFFSTILRTGSDFMALAVACSANGAQAVEEVIQRLTLNNLLNNPNELFQRWSMNRPSLTTVFQSLNVPLSDIQQYIIRNAPQEAPNPPPSETNNATEQHNNIESMEVDDVPSPATNAIPVAAVPPTPHPPAVLEDTSEPLPNVVYGSQPWHRDTPEEWVPIIARDIQKQKKQSSQPPFSDAYLAGMPSKKRKLIEKAKPDGSISDIITDSVRQAVTAVGLQSVAPLEEVAQAAGESLEIQTAFRSLLQSTVRSNLENNEDFTPERYPNTSRFFNNDSTAE
ncbi:large proline-rich protein bag6-B isoform X2 [Anthonomus grandis grandis]|uniref:large proline-rich protein bag6-B isoform X2 n=1 Tax=Anthonomus grandis grandis TaxID=2921223 RepID=UPI002166979D|nr:large proline-rich protein bag6-B isoform X2 [Anthonomus grandis grandis]